MANIFITGSADGLGELAARQLVQQGHQVVLHARNEKRGQEALQKLHGAATVLIGDLSSLEETKQLAADANAFGDFDAVIHNAGVYQASSEMIIKVNTLAPYILTCLIQRPKRLIYLSSGMHEGGQPRLKQLAGGTDGINYSDSKLHDLLLTKAVARLWSDVYVNAVDPGWVPTKMGGSDATGNLEKGYETQSWLAVSDEPEALVSGGYFYHQQQRPYHAKADEVSIQDEFMLVCEQLTGVKFPK